MNNWWEDNHLQPPSGSQTVGEHGPYYILSGDQVIRIPKKNICRDRRYALSISDVDQRQCAENGMSDVMQASVFLSSRPLTKRLVVVVTDNGWARGEETTYTWCIRLLFKTTNPSSRNCMNSDHLLASNDGVVSESSSQRLTQYGAKVLWPLPPQYAMKAFREWSCNNQATESKLITYYKPSLSKFSWTSIPEALIMNSVPLCTIRTVQSFNPLIPNADSYSDPWKSKIKDDHLDTQFKRDDDTLPLFSSNSYLTTTVEKHDSRCNAHTVIQFTANNEVGWNALGFDEQELIWNMVAQYCVQTPGNAKSSAFQTWLSLRSVCKQSKQVLEHTTLKFMESAFQLLSKSSDSKSVADAIQVRNIFVRSGIIPHAFQAEITYMENRKKPLDSISKSIWPYVRIKTQKQPSKLPPKFAVKSKNPVADYTLANANNHTQRKSARIQDKQHSELPPSYTRITIRMRNENESISHPPTESSIRTHDLPILATPPTPPTPPTPRRTRDAEKSVPFTGPIPAVSKRTRSADTKHVSSVPETSSKSMKMSLGECDNWVQCTQCDEWRILPNSNGLVDSLSLCDLPEHWVCSMHPSCMFTCGIKQALIPDEANQFKRNTRSRCKR